MSSIHNRFLLAGFNRAVTASPAILETKTGHRKNIPLERALEKSLNDFLKLSGHKRNHLYVIG
jgi:hypothetical protein